VPRGTHERFIGFRIERYAGNFPLAGTFAPLAFATWKQDKFPCAFTTAARQARSRKGEVVADILASIRERRA
jgi:hypothetical protein